MVKKLKVNSGIGLTGILRAMLPFISLICFLIPGLFANFSGKLNIALYILGYVFWAAAAISAFVRLYAEKDMDKRQFFYKNKSDIIFCAVTVVLLPVSVFTDIRVLGVFVAFGFPGTMRKFNDERVFQISINILAVLLIAVFVLPFCNVIAVAISSPDQIINLIPKNIDFFSVREVLSDKGFYKAMGVSVFVTAVGTLLSVTAMAMAAYPLSKKDLPFRRPLMMFFIIVMLFSGGMAPNMLLMNYLHLNNTVWSLIFPSVVQVFYLILLKGFFEDVPAELEESARLDGANNYTILFKIVLPIAAPMVITVAFFTMISYWNNINNAILYITSNQEVYPLPMYIRNFLNRNPMDVAMTNPELVRYWDNVKMSYVLFSIVPVLIVYPFTFKYLKNGVAVGAVKG